ncbi:hypothetical protein ACFW04_013546 [Cataglyphis niger]
MLLPTQRQKILICGDFNSKSKLWGSPFSDERGTTIDEWAAASDLRLLNTGSDPTCIRAQGCSIIDLTWASPGLVRYISSWQVLDLSTLSDHVYIVVKFDNNRQVDASAPRKKSMYWWMIRSRKTRADTNAAYRAWKRIRRIRNPNPHEEELLRQRYRIARKKLRAEINTAKSVAWKELLDWQFGFRDSKSTHDAINHVKVVAGAAMSEGGFTVGVSIDICNAFNSVPWSTIRRP